MKWSWHIGQVAGIRLYLHATLLILLAWVGYEYYSWRHRVGDVAEAVVFICSFFVIVLLHELGHALAARRYGIRTRDITIMPIGGLARMERMPDKPLQELVVALAGPAVNLALAAFLGAVYWGAIGPVSNWERPGQIELVGAHFMLKLVLANLVMAGFNLVPAFPMDGGRVLRSLLVMRLGYARATRWAVDIGQALAFGFGAVGLYSMHPLWVFIALFVYLGAEEEAEMVKMKSVLAGVPIQRVMITDVRTLLPTDPLQRAVECILAGFQQEFPVVEGGRVVGVLTRRGLMTALAQQGPATAVGAVMQREFRTAGPNEEAETVFAHLAASDCHSLPVVDQDRLVGIVTAENVGEYLMIQSALRGGGKARRSG